MKGGGRLKKLVRVTPPMYHGLPSSADKSDMDLRTSLDGTYVRSGVTGMSDVLMPMSRNDGQC
jgi:hypothetical protein